jgi:hypothetical protein
MARLRWTMLLVAALLLAACRAEVTLELALQEDGSGSYRTDVGADDDLREALGAFADPSELLGSFDFGLPGTVVDERREGDMTFTTVSGQFTDVSEISELIDSGQTQGLFEEFDVVVDDDGARINALIVLPEQLTQFADQSDVIAEQLEFSASIVVDLPGRIVTSNATRSIGDNRLVWELALTDTEIDIQAESTFREAGFPWWIVVVAVLAAAILAGWWWWTRRQRRAIVERLGATESALGNGPN